MKASVKRSKASSEPEVVKKTYSVRERKGEKLLDHLLFYRGITNEEDKERFLYPSYKEGLNDPYLLSDMEKAITRINGAIEKGEKILIYTDYDCDGIPAGVIMADYFKMIGYENVENYIPHRHLEGFGLNEEAIESIAKNKANLLITFDCGITDIAHIDRANKLGMDVIITDHHVPGDKLPKAFAIINPKTSPDYPDQMLCGSGVAFKLVEALLKNNRRDVPEGKEKWLLDMVGIATLSDMVPLVGENRVLAHYGLKVLRKSPRVGIKKLLSVLKISQEDLTEDDVGFMIAPRINVASRMGHPIDAFRLLSTTDAVEAEDLVEKLNHLNNERKGTVGSIVKEVEKKIEDRGLEDKPVIVLGNPSWNPAVLGLVANSLMKEHRKPVFLWGRSEGDTLKGSCRSEGQTDVVALMNGASKDIFVDFGGHTMSGGFSVSADHIHLLDEALQKSYEKLFSENKAKKAEYIADSTLSMEEINFTLWNDIEKLAPFGIENQKPVFLFTSVIPSLVKRFGKASEHLELIFNTATGKKISAIFFFADKDPRFESLTTTTPITLVASLEKSMFKRYPELRLRIIDVC